MTPRYQSSRPGKLVFGNALICPRCKKRRGNRTVWGSGRIECSRDRANVMLYKIVWSPNGNSPYDRVDVVCPDCNGTGIVQRNVLP